MAGKFSAHCAGMVMTRQDRDHMRGPIPRQPSSFSLAIHPRTPWPRQARPCCNVVFGDHGAELRSRGIAPVLGMSKNLTIPF